jgi:ketose-bisphosphate aldolase
MPSLLKDARSRGYAVGYFESWNLESLKAVICAAEEAGSPVIIGFNGGMLVNSRRVLEPENLEFYGAMGRIAARNAKVPVALILNEIDTLPLVVDGIQHGFNAIMFENRSDRDSSLTRSVVELAHATGVAVELNVGQLPSADQGGLRKRDKVNARTRPEMARRFVGNTGVDALGVSVGNVEVLMKGKATMDFRLLEKIHKATDVFLTLHGGSGIADGDVRRLIACGVSKMNLGAALNRAFLSGMEKVWKTVSSKVSPKYGIGSGLREDLLAAGEIAMKELVQHKMSVYGSAGRV